MGAEGHVYEVQGIAVSVPVEEAVDFRDGYAEGVGVWGDFGGYGVGELLEFAGVVVVFFDVGVVAVLN